MHEVWCQPEQSRGGGAALPMRAPEAIRGPLHVQPMPFQSLHPESNGGPQERPAPGPSGQGPGPNLLWDPETHQGGGNLQAAASTAQTWGREQGGREAKGGQRVGSHSWAPHKERHSVQRGKRRSQEPLSKCFSLGKQPSPKQRKQDPAVPPENVDGEMVRTYLQRLCNGDPQKLAALAGVDHEATSDDLQEPAEMSLTDAIIEAAEQPGSGIDPDTDPLLMEKAAAVPVDVSTLEEVATEDNLAAEEPSMPIKLPKVPRLAAPYRYAAVQQCLRPLPSPVWSLSLRQIGPEGKPSTQDHKLILKLHTQLVAMTRELHRVHKLQQEQLTLQGQQLELQ